MSKEATVTPTREELLEARIAYLGVWHQDAEAGHAQAVAENGKLREEVGMLRLKLAKRGCCKVDGGEDATT